MWRGRIRAQRKLAIREYLEIFGDNGPYLDTGRNVVKIGIVGAGQVGATAAYPMMMRRRFRNHARRPQRPRCSTVSPTAATFSKPETTASVSKTARRKPPTRKGEISELDERLTSKPSSSRVSSRWKSGVGRLGRAGLSLAIDRAAGLSKDESPWLNTASV